MALPQEFLNIDTPENVVFDYEVVGIGSRFMAALVDTLLIIVLQAIAYLASFFILANLTEWQDSWGGWIAAVFALITFALLWGYYIFFELWWNGQTPGKRLTGLRVIRSDGTPITLTESIIRNLVRLVDFLPLFYGVGIVAMFIDRQSRRLGDFAAGTLVVRDQEEVTLESLGRTPKIAIPPTLRQNIETQVAAWPLELLEAPDIQLAEDFLKRRQEIAGSHDLALQIVDKFLARMEIPKTEINKFDALYYLSAIIKLHKEGRAR